MKQLFGCLLVAGMVGLLVAGCEWTGTKGSASWDSSFNWVNFSGTYRAQDGGEMVVNHGVLVINPDTTITNNAENVHNQFQYDGKGTDVSIYEGELHSDLVPGSVVIVAGSHIFTDDGAGILSSSGGLEGTIEYDTGKWSIDLGAGFVAETASIKATYSFYPRASGGVSPGSDGTNEAQDYPWSGIYSMRIEQLGNHLRIVDGKFGQYEGIITTVSNGGGDMTGSTSGNIEAQFEVTGRASDGRAITIVGSFLGGYIAPSVADAATTGTGSAYGALQGRILQAIWVEPDGTTADVVGEAGTVEIDLSAYTSPTRTVPGGTITGF
jgi:hypothetical protein